MQNRGMMIRLGIVGLAVAALSTACGDEGPTGPQFGDLRFTPSFVSIGVDRSVTLMLENASGSSLGPILMGIDVIFLATNVDDICDGTPEMPIVVTISPTTIQSLGPGEQREVNVQFDLSGATAETCTPGQQEAQLPAAVNNRILATASIRFTWDGTPP